MKTLLLAVMLNGQTIKVPLPSMEECNKTLQEMVLYAPGAFLTIVCKTPKRIPLRKR